MPRDSVFSCSCGRSRTLPNSPIPQVPRRSTPRVIRHTLEPPIPAPVLCGNAFAALSEESLYDSPLDLGLSVEALAAAPVPRARRHCLSAVSVCSGVDAQAKPAISSDHRAEATFPVIDEPELVSRAPAHLGQTFVKQALSLKSTKPALNLGKEVADIVRGLGIPCKDTDFHCPI